MNAVQSTNVRPDCITVPAVTSYLCEAGFSAATVIKDKYCRKISMEKMIGMNQEIRAVVSNLDLRFETL